MILIRTKNGIYPAEHCVFKRTVEEGNDYLMLSCLGTAEFFKVEHYEAVLDEIHRLITGALNGYYSTVALESCIFKAERNAQE